MELLLKPIVKNDICTISDLYVNGILFCQTLEDRVRISNKIKNETAIPEGKYEVKLTYSNHFKKIMPLICNVNGFEGVRIHIGNKPEDTSGCLLVGVWNGGNVIKNSTVTFEKLMHLLEEETQKKKMITIEIVR